MGKIKYFLIGTVLLLGLIFVLIRPGANGYTALQNFEGQVDFYKSESCGCCDLHAGYLQRNGKLNVNRIEMQSIANVKKERGVPLELQSCHTAMIDGYFVEGHIPLEAINKLLKEKPKIRGIAMPGMPSGSPGMPGAKAGDFVIYGVNEDGSYYEFMKI